MMIAVLIIGFCASAVALLLYAEKNNIEPLRAISKSLASATFIVLALILGALGSLYGQIILAGLALCMAGDVLLLSRQESRFLAGMVAFALGHMAYACAFIVYGTSLKPAIWLAFMAMGATGYVVLKQLWPHLGTMRWPVSAYVAIISAMVVLSVAVTPQMLALGPTQYTGQAFNWLLISGAVGFAVSDIAVARDQFIARNFFNRAWGLPLYYGAQLLLASSV